MYIYMYTFVYVYTYIYILGTVRACKKVRFAVLEQRSVISSDVLRNRWFSIDAGLVRKCMPGLHCFWCFEGLSG